MKRKNKTSLLKKIVNTLPVLIGGVAVVYLGLLVKDVEAPSVLPVNEIQIKGELYFVDKKEIEAMVKSNISGDYFTIDLNNIRDILIQEPWIKSVSLRRQWPASLTVFIEEQRPVAYWNDDGYINESGNVFKPVVIDKKLNIPKLNGPEGQHNSVWKFMNVLYQETALLNYEVVRLDLDDRRAWQLVIASNQGSENPGAEVSRIDIKLGRFDTEKRMQRFIRILPALTIEYGLAKNKKTKDGIVENKIKVIDMRYPNGFAVQMAEKDNSQTQNFLPKQNIPHDFVYQQKHATVQMSEA
jgi:cell division protein FtsQ